MASGGPLPPEQGVIRFFRADNDFPESPAIVFGKANFLTDALANISPIETIPLMYCLVKVVCIGRAIGALAISPATRPSVLFP